MQFCGCETWSLVLREKRRLRVFKNGVLRRIFGPKRDEVTGEWRRLCNEELNDLYSSPNIIRVIRSRKMVWAGHVACMGEIRGTYRVLARKLRKRDHFEDLGVGGRIILKLIFKKWDGGLDWIDLAQNREKCFCECGNEPSGSIQCEEFLE
jgi:hypothetical protein